MKIALTSIPVDDPVKAHEFYTKVLGFKSKHFDAASQLAIVVSPEESDGSALLLEPRGDTFVKEFQSQVYQAGLPFIIFGVDNLSDEITRLKESGVVFREDLENKEWGMVNIFEDTCGNFIMLQENENG